jgi:MFS family permease
MAQGLLTGSSGLATILGATLGGIIAGAIGIPGLFAICAVVSIIGAGIVAAAIVAPLQGAVRPAN